MKKILFSILTFALIVPGLVRAQDVPTQVDQPIDPEVLGISTSIPQQLRDQLATYRCQFIDCEQEATAIFGDIALADADALSALSDFGTVTSTKRDQQTKDVADLVNLREYKLSQAQLAAKQGVPESPCESGKCILVIISRQMTYAFEDGRVMNTTAVSTGVRGHNTPTGTYHVYGKTAKQKMSGPGYYMPNVPWILWWSGDYSIHGTYWHSNFGHPMSHGCVNMPTPTAKWFFDWAPVGTPVIIRSS